jgi:hypothetical protein
MLISNFSVKRVFATSPAILAVLPGNTWLCCKCPCAGRFINAMLIYKY